MPSRDLIIGVAIGLGIAGLLYLYKRKKDWEKAMKYLELVEEGRIE